MSQIAMISATINFAIIIGQLEDENNKCNKKELKEEEDNLFKKANV